MDHPSKYLDKMAKFAQTIFSGDLWASIFGWESLFRWDVLGAIVPGVFLAGAIGLMSIDWFPHNLLISQICFGICGVLCVAKTIGHAVRHQSSSTSNKVVFCILICTVIIGLDAYFISVIQWHKSTLELSEKSRGGEKKPEYSFSVVYNGGNVNDGTSKLTSPMVLFRNMNIQGHGSAKYNLAPVDVSLLLSLTNTGKSPASIAYYEAEAQKIDGAWKPLCTVSEVLYETVIIDKTKLSKSYEEDLDQTGFDRKLKNVVLVPYMNPMVGWTFFEFSEGRYSDYEDDGRHPLTIRMTIHTQDGGTATELVKSARPSQPFFSENTRYFPQTIDLSNARILNGFPGCPRHETLINGDHQTSDFLSLKFKETKFLSSKMRERITEQFDDSYIFLKSLGMAEAPTDLPMIGVETRKDAQSENRSPGPSYYSNVQLTPGRLDDDFYLRWVYMSFATDKLLRMDTVGHPQDSMDRWAFSQLAPKYLASSSIGTLHDKRCVSSWSP